MTALAGSNHLWVTEENRFLPCKFLMALIWVVATVFMFSSREEIVSRPSQLKQHPGCVPGFYVCNFSANVFSFEGTSDLGCHS